MLVISTVNITLCWAMEGGESLKKKEKHANGS